LSTLSDFLLRNSVVPGGTLPAIHTTQAYHLKYLQNTNKLLVTECDVFSPDKLSYFFVGRPAYKYQTDGSEAEYWELPCCFIFEFASVKGIKRIFPFDSGAFRKLRYPPYIRQMDWKHFEATAAPDAVSRIIGAFFGDLRSYFSFKSKDLGSFEKEFDLRVFDAEIKALHRLSREKSPATFDDRRFTIELQSDVDLDLNVSHPLAVIAPLPYFDEPTFRNHVETTWKATPIGYPVYTLSVEQYFHAVYERVEEFFKARGLL
jgi:hypothetical protein